MNKRKIDDIKRKRKFLEKKLLIQKPRILFQKSKGEITIFRKGLGTKF